MLSQVYEEFLAQVVPPVRKPMSAEDSLQEYGMCFSDATVRTIVLRLGNCKHVWEKKLHGLW